MQGKRSVLWVLLSMVFVCLAWFVAQVPDYVRQSNEAARATAQLELVRLEHNAEHCFAIDELGRKFGPVLTMERAAFGESRLHLSGGASTLVTVQQTIGCK